MDKQELLNRLNWFYTLEINQVNLYMTQGNEADDPHLRLAFKKFADIEQTHVENIRAVIEEQGETPRIIGEIVGRITGKIAGALSNLPAAERTLRFDIALENKAISDYRALIDTVDDERIRDVLWSNMIDEELHTCWMLRHAEEYRRQHEWI